MWRTQCGDRALKPAEWELFREGIDRLWDEIEMASSCPEELVTGVDVFDNLQTGQKLAMLLRVGKALRDRAEPTPDLTAITEGTVAAVFGYLRNELSVEIDIEDDIRRHEPDQVDEATRIRRRIVAACSGWREYRRYKFPAENSKELAIWDSLLEDMANKILWEDGDYDMAADFIDEAPEDRDAQMAMMGIAPAYFLDIAPDPTDTELAGIRDALTDLTGRKATDRIPEHG